MRYYLKKCTHQELGSVGTDGKAQRGRYLLTSMNESVLSMFPPLSTAQLNDSALLQIIPLYLGKKVYCNFVYHNDKFHGSTVAHPRNEYRIYLNKELEDHQLLFKTNDIIVIRADRVADEDNPEREYSIYYLDHVPNDGSALYKMLDSVISVYPIKGGYGIYDGVIKEFEDNVARVSKPDDCEVVIDDSITKQISTNEDKVASLFNSVSFRDFVMVGYNNLCAITGTVIKYDTYMNLEAAHIKPKSHGGLYMPNNGIALCRDLHWAFDKGFFTIDNTYCVRVHPKVESDYLSSFNGKQIRMPSDPFFVPDLENLKYHRENVYGLFLATGRL